MHSELGKSDAAEHKEVTQSRNCGRCHFHVNCQIDFAMKGREKFKSGTSKKTSGNWNWKLMKKIDIWKVQIQGTLQ